MRADSDAAEQKAAYPPIRLGDIFMVDWSPGRGSEQTGERPAVIVQNDGFNTNERYPLTIVVAVTTKGRELPNIVPVPKTAENGLWEVVSYVKCEQIQTISKDRLGRRLGRLTDEEIRKVGTALKRVLSLR